jgi:hypothetical protein
MGDMRDLMPIDNVFQCRAVTNIADFDIDPILDVGHQSEIHPIVHQHWSQTVLHHQARGYRAVHAETAGNQNSHFQFSMRISLSGLARLCPAADA